MSMTCTHCMRTSDDTVHRLGATGVGIETAVIRLSCWVHRHVPSPKTRNTRTRSDPGCRVAGAYAACVSRRAGGSRLQEVRARRAQARTIARAAISTEVMVIAISAQMPPNPIMK